MLSLLIFTATNLALITPDQMAISKHYQKYISHRQKQSKDGSEPNGPTPPVPGIPITPAPILRTAKMHYVVEKFMNPGSTEEYQEVTYTPLCEGTANVNVHDVSNAGALFPNGEVLVCNASLIATPNGEARPHEMIIGRSMFLLPAEAGLASKVFFVWMEVQPTDEPWVFDSRRYSSLDVMTDVDTKHMNSHMIYDSPTGGENVVVAIEFEDFQK